VTTLDRKHPGANLARMNIIYGLRLPTRDIAPANGTAHKRNCLKALALHQVIGCVKRPK